MSIFREVIAVIVNLDILETTVKQVIQMLFLRIIEKITYLEYENTSFLQIFR